MKRAQSIFRSWIQITTVRNDGDRQFAFAVTMEPIPRVVYIPPHLVKKFELTEEDVGNEFECMFIIHDDKPNVCAIGLSEDGYDVRPAVGVGVYDGASIDVV